MKRLILLLVVLLGLSASAPVMAADDARKHVILVDGSGSMEDPAEGVHLYTNGKLEALLKTLVAVDKAFAPADLVEVGIFSKTDGDRTSPSWVFKGTVSELRSRWFKLAPLGGWTDLAGALDAGLAQIKPHKGPQFIWMLTDNIDQAADETGSTESFYQSLAAHTELHRIYVFPVDVKEKNGLVLYAMARERSGKSIPEESRLLDEAVAALGASLLKANIGEGGFLARPLNEDTLRVEIAGFTADPAISPNATYSFDRATGAITLRGFAEQKPIRGKFQLKISSRFPALRIVDAKVSAELTGMSSGLFIMPEHAPQVISPTRVSLAPGQTASYVIDLDVAPPFMLWNPFKEPLGALEDEGTIEAQLRLVVEDVVFEAVQPEKFYKVHLIPAILGNRSDVAIPLSAPVVMHVALPWWRLLELLIFLLAVIGLMTALYMATLGRRRWIRVWSDHFDLLELVSLRRSIVVPGFGLIKATAGGGLIFIPDGAGNAKRALKGTSGEIALGDRRSFFYSLRAPRTSQRKGGRSRASDTGLY